MTENSNPYFNDLETRCDRKIFRSPFEHGTAAGRRWWNDLFAIIEADATIPPQRKMDILCKVFKSPHKLLDDHIVLATQILGVDTVKFDKFYKEFIRKYSLEHDSPSDGGSVKSSRKLQTSLITEKTPRDLEDVCIRGGANVGKRNPYKNFFRCRAERAAIWRKYKPIVSGFIDLNEQAEVIVGEIATDFINWYRKYRDEEDDEEAADELVTVSNLLQMFDMGSQTHAAKSVRIKLETLTSVSNELAEARGLPEKATRSMLFEEIRKDISLRVKRPPKIAFGKRQDYTKGVSPEEISKQWLECDHVPQNLATMATVWDGITNLKSTRAFCEYLINHSEIKPPQFLVDNGLLDRKVLSRTKSDDMIEQGIENVEDVLEKFANI